LAGSASKAFRRAPGALRLTTPARQTSLWRDAAVDLLVAQRRVAHDDSQNGWEVV